MTTQATPSNSALGRRSLPSTFFTPIQTARRYMERQRGGDERDPGDGAGSETSGRSESAASANQAPSQARSQAADQAAGQVQDLLQGQVQDLLQGQVRDSLQGQVRDSLQGPVLVPAQNSVHNQQQGQPQYGSPRGVPEELKLAQPMAFAEVARRVWGETPQTVRTEPVRTRERVPAAAAVPEPVGTEPVGTEQVGTEQVVTDRAGAAQIGVQQAGAERAGQAPGVIATMETIAATADGERQVRLRSGTDPADRPVSALTRDGKHKPGKALAHDPAEGVASGSVPSLVSGSAPGAAGDTANGLAHDANNLLSALRLYSELLSFSGVLHDRHRHYADDLKLLSLRSQSLIGRLLLLAEQVGVAQAAEVDTAAAGPAARQIDAGAAGAGGAGAGSAGAGSAGAEWTGAEGTGAEWAGAEWTGAEWTGAEWTGIDWAEVVPEAAAGPVSVTETIRCISGVLGTIAHGALEVKLPEQGGAEQNGLRIAADAEALERILVNLVANAAAAIRDGGAVRIGVSLSRADAPAAGKEPDNRRSPEVVLTVDDSGCGMGEAELAAALGLAPAPTLLAEASAPAAIGRRARGRGLGLSIVRQLVGETGGSFSAFSQPGRGTRIEIRWAVADEGSQPVHGARPGPRPLSFASRQTARPASGIGPMAVEPADRGPAVSLGAPRSFKPNLLEPSRLEPNMLEPNRLEPSRLDPNRLGGTKGAVAC